MNENVLKILVLLFLIGITITTVLLCKGCKSKDGYESSCLYKGEDPFANCNNKCCKTCFNPWKGKYFCAKDSCPQGQEFAKPSCCPDRCPSSCSYLCGSTPTPPRPPPSGDCLGDGVCRLPTFSKIRNLKYEDFQSQSYIGDDPSSCAIYSDKHLSRRSDGGISLGYHGRKTSRMMSNKNFNNGLFIFTVSFPTDSATFPAIWLYNLDDGNNGEIDILETMKGRNSGTFNLVRNNPWATTMLDKHGNFNSYGGLYIGDKSKFHTYVLYRNNNKVISYVDPIIEGDTIRPSASNKFVSYNLYDTHNNSGDHSAMSFLIGKRMRIVLNVAVNDQDNPHCTFDKYMKKHCSWCPNDDRGSMEVKSIIVKEF